jgi:hypothetical protein
MALTDIMSRKKVRYRMPEIVALWFQARPLALVTCKLLEQLGCSVRGNLVLTSDKRRELHANRMRTAVLPKREVNPTRGALCGILLALGSLGVMEAQEAPLFPS